MAQPGVMIYFSLRPSIKRLTMAEKGALFDAILAYGEERIEPDFQGVLALAWDFVKPILERDSERYDAQVQQRRYAVYVREAKRQGDIPLSFDEWSEQELSDDEPRHPITNTNPKSTPMSKSVSNTIPNSVGASPSPRPRFAPPGVEEVRLYCQEKGYQMDPEPFVDYYTSNGWMVGKNKMKDWKAAVRSWQRKEDQHGNEHRALRTEATGAAAGWTVGTVL